MQDPGLGKSQIIERKSAILSNPVYFLDIRRGNRYIFMWVIAAMGCDSQLSAVQRKGEREEFYLCEGRVDMTQTVKGELKVLGKSPEISRVRRAIKNAAKIDDAVLLIGETGTEKRFIAEHIHKISDRSEGPFLLINCGAIGDTIDENKVFSLPPNGEPAAEPQLFAAKGGTIYLERIDRLSTALQNRLYNFLDTCAARQSKLSLHARFICSAEPSLAAALERNEFRQDLFQRLSAIRIHVPALRERKQDIPFLFNHVLEQLCQDYGKTSPAVPYKVFDAILAYPWPGNMHEMRNVIRNLVIMSPEGELSADYLPFYSKPDPLEFLEGTDIPTAVSEVEKYLIQKALAKYDGNQSKAARLLQLSEAALRYKMKKYGFPSAR